jgi:hypothetical protein
MKLTAAVTIEPAGPLHLASMFSMRDIAMLGELTNQEKDDNYLDGTGPTVNASVDGDRVAIKFNWASAENPLRPGHKLPAIASFTVEVTKDVEDFDPSIANDYAPQRELVRHAVLKVSKRLLSFFRFKLHNPFTWPIQTATFKTWKWLDSEGNEIYQNPIPEVRVASFLVIPSPAIPPN